MSGEAVLTQAVDPASDRPVYKQIADHLREAIGRGRLLEGDQLPSEVQLMSHYGVARMTVRNALRLLQAGGLITAEHGRGVYVRARPPVRRLASDRFARRHRKEGKAAFIAAVVGGIGSLPGAAVGGLVIGLAQSFSIGYISSTFSDAIVFAVLIAVMVLRPSGLLGRAAVQKV